MSILICNYFLDSSVQKASAVEGYQSRVLIKDIDPGYLIQQLRKYKLLNKIPCLLAIKFPLKVSNVTSVFGFPKLHKIDYFQVITICSDIKCQLREILREAWWPHGQWQPWTGQIERSRFKLWLGTLCCILGQDTLEFSHYLSPPSCKIMGRRI